MGVLAGVEWALITGASGGIGEAFARQLAALGKNLVVVARSGDRLEAVSAELAARHGVQTQVIAADLARPDAAASVFAKTEHLGLKIDLLVNNAGFGKAGDFTELPFDAQADMLRLNINTLMELTRLYLPAMRRRRCGGVINVASNAAFQPVPYMAVYGASKAFVLSFSEAVSEEVRQDGVIVMALCPGATATGFWKVAGLPEGGLGRVDRPEKVVAVALRGFERRKLWAIPGVRYRLAAFLSSRLVPRRPTLWITGWVFRRQQ
jgi:hypothetical protein